MSALRWGILSTARINDALLEAREAEVVAVASRSQDRAEDYARRKGLPRAHGSYEALLEDPDIDAVYISLPNALHLPWAVRALEAGKHVLCEKPLSRHAAEVEAAFDTAARAGRLLVEGLMWRHHPQVARAQALLADGAIGRPALGRATFSFPLGDAADPRLSRALGGGALMDVGCYCVSGLRALMGGEPEEALAMCVAGDDDVDVLLNGLLRFGAGRLAVIDCGMALAARQGLEIVGDEGILRLLDPWHTGDPVIVIERAGATERIAAEPADRYALQLRDFAAAATGGHAPLLGRDDAVGQARTIEALYASAERGVPVTIGG